MACVHFQDAGHEDCWGCKVDLDRRMYELNWQVNDRYDYTKEKNVREFECTVCGQRFEWEPAAKHDLQECYERFAERIKAAFERLGKF